MIPNTQDIKKCIEDQKDEILEWVKKLITFPSENKPPKGYEGEAQKFLANELSNLGLKVFNFSPDSVDKIKEHPYWLTGRDYSNNREDVVAVWEGTENGNSILLSGHIDVAPREPERWKVCNPFSPIVIDNKLYGRGSADMKGGLSAMYWAIRVLKELDFKPEGNILFESIVDEEYAGGNGTLAARLKGFNTDFAIISEPSRMEICPASMGAFLGKIKIVGKAGMPYMGKGIPNPINAAGRIINFLEDWQTKWRSMNNHPLFDESGKELNVIIWDLVSGKRDEFVQMGIPIEVTVSWIVFCYPGTQEEDFYKLFLKYLSGRIEKDKYLSSFDIDIIKDYHYVRPWETNIDNEGVISLSNSFESYINDKPKVGGAPFSCDLAIYGDLGNMPCVILGPRGGNLHAPDEWVLIDDIYSLIGIYAHFITKWCSS